MLMVSPYTQSAHVCTYLVVVKLHLVQLRRIIREGIGTDKRPDFNEFMPDDHQLGMQVTKGGSMCANCKWVSDDGKSCGNDHFQAWQERVRGAEDGSKLPKPADEYCCDLWHPA
jgi:hypothetical protein